MGIFHAHTSLSHMQSRALRKDEYDKDALKGNLEVA